MPASSTRPKVTRRQWLLAAAGTGAAASGAAADRAPVRFALNRGPYDASNGPFLLAQDRGRFETEGVEVEFSLSHDAADALQRVASDEFDFGFVDLSVLMLAALRSGQPSPLGVFVVFDRSPACVVTWKAAGASGAQGLAGRRLAVVEGDGAYQMFPLFLRAAGVDAEAIRLQKVTLAQREATMLRREVDGAVGFDSTIAFKLRAAGIGWDEFDIRYFADAGLDLVSNTVIVSRRMLQTRSQLVAGVVRACARGWRDALAQPQALLDALARRSPGLDTKKEAERFEWLRRHQIVTPAVLQRGLGAADPARLARLLAQMQAGVPAGAAPGPFYSDAYLPALADRLVV